MLSAETHRIKGTELLFPRWIGWFLPSIAIIKPALSALYRCQELSTISEDLTSLFMRVRGLIWGCIKTNLAIFGGMNIHLPVIWGSLGYQGFDSYPSVEFCWNLRGTLKFFAPKTWRFHSGRTGHKNLKNIRWNKARWASTVWQMLWAAFVRSWGYHFG